MTRRSAAARGRGLEPELRLGRWQDVGADIIADAVITDTPFGARVHHRRITTTARYDGSSAENCGPAGHYHAWTAGQVYEFVAAWHPRCRGWLVALTSHDLIPAWEIAHREVDRYMFAPIPCVVRGMSVRLCGDGPSSWTIYAVAARPRTKRFARWGTLDGAYVGARQAGAAGGRGKPAWLMEALVRDYSRRGDLVVDPCCGWGSTLAAARALGRCSIGIDVDAGSIAEAQRRLAVPAADVFVDEERRTS